MPGSIRRTGSQPKGRAGWSGRRRRDGPGTARWQETFPRNRSSCLVGPAAGGCPAVTCDDRSVSGLDGRRSNEICKVPPGALAAEEPARCDEHHDASEWRAPRRAIGRTCITVVEHMARLAFAETRRGGPVRKGKGDRGRQRCRPHLSCAPPTSIEVSQLPLGPPARCIIPSASAHVDMLAASAPAIL